MRVRVRERERERLTEAVELAAQGLHGARRRARERADIPSDGRVYKHCAAWREEERTHSYNSSQHPQCHCIEQCGSKPEIIGGRERERERKVP